MTLSKHAMASSTFPTSDRHAPLYNKQSNLVGLTSLIRPTEISAFSYSFLSNSSMPLLTNTFSTVFFKRRPDLRSELYTHLSFQYWLSFTIHFEAFLL